LRIATEHGGCLCLDQFYYHAYHYMADPTIPDFLIGWNKSLGTCFFLLLWHLVVVYALIASISCTSCSSSNSTGDSAIERAPNRSRHDSSVRPLRARLWKRWKLQPTWKHRRSKKKDLSRLSHLIQILADPPNGVLHKAFERFARLVKESHLFFLSCQLFVVSFFLCW
jgi:hypothetical protein